MNQQFGIEQLWFDVDRPIEPRRMRMAPRRSPRVEATDRQMELRMVAPDPVCAPEPPGIEVPPRPVPIPPAPPAEADPVEAPPPPFGTWLLEQTQRRGTLGELAKAAKLDRYFPRKGSADEVRARFNAAGADGDAFEALDDAERAYARHI